MNLKNLRKQSIALIDTLYDYSIPHTEEYQQYPVSAPESRVLISTSESDEQDHTSSYCNLPKIFVQ